MKIIKNAAESMICWMEFTIDLPSMHDSGKVPMLDIEVWIEEVKGEKEEDKMTTVLAWNFYEKPSASC